MNIDESSDDISEEEDTMENNLILIGLFGFTDDKRQGIQKSVNLCHCNSVVVRVVSGDSLGTCIKVAEHAGLIS